MLHLNVIYVLYTDVCANRKETRILHKSKFSFFFRKRNNVVMMFFYETL